MAALIDPGLRAQLDVAAGSVSVLGLLLDCPKGSLAVQVPVSCCSPAVPAGRQPCDARASLFLSCLLAGEEQQGSGICMCISRFYFWCVLPAPAGSRACCGCACVCRAAPQLRAWLWLAEQS